MLPNVISRNARMESWSIWCDDLKYARILTFFLVSDVVSSELKSRLGAVMR